MRKFTLSLVVVLGLSIFANQVYGKVQPQNLSLGIFSFIQQLFWGNESIPSDNTKNETNTGFVTNTWIRLFSVENWFSPVAAEKFVEGNKPETAGTVLPTEKSTENVVLSQQETTKTIVTPTSTITITKTSKKTTQPEAIDISEMMRLLEEVGAGSQY